MSFINYAKKEVNCKIIYVGTGLGGKTTNVQYIYEQSQDQSGGELVTLSTENERTLFFDFLPLDAGGIAGFQTRFHLYTIPGQTFYDISQDFILKGVDGIVFVVDSQVERMEANEESFQGLRRRLENQGYDLEKVPLVLQYNKRDLHPVNSVEELERKFNPGGRRPYVEAVAMQGKGVMETLQEISELVVRDLKGGTAQ